jgi:mannitol/fructose-specific phosphotransferase system IIA component (Ntr-type)
MSTGLGLGVAVPHVRDTFIKEIIISFAHIRPPLKDYESLDDIPVEFIAMILAPKNHHEAHINLLSEISNRLKKESVRKNIRNAFNPREIYAALIA